MAGNDCTFSDPTRFYSFRRDRTTGRHAALDLARLTGSRAVRRIRAKETKMPTSTATTSAAAGRARRLHLRAAPSKSRAESQRRRSPPLSKALSEPRRRRRMRLPPSPDQLMQLQQDYLTRLATLMDRFLSESREVFRADCRFALFGSRVAEQFIGVVLCARVSAECGLHESAGRYGRCRSQDQAAGQVRGVAMGRCGFAFEFSGDQSEGAADVARIARRKSEVGSRQPDEGHPARPHFADR